MIVKEKCYIVCKLFESQGVDSRIAPGRRTRLALGHENMLRGFVIAAALLGISAILAGCAEEYPRLPEITKMDNLLTPQQREQTIKDLQGTSATQAPAAKMPEGQK